VVVIAACVPITQLFGLRNSFAYGTGSLRFAAAGCMSIVARRAMLAVHIQAALGPRPVNRSQLQ